MTTVQSDLFYMKRALSLAAKGKGATSPNPMVGAVIVNHGRIVGEAYHRRAGQPHAEILALHRAGPRARGGVLYVTLEPCCHTNKRTPPCVPLIKQAGLKRVCVATIDYNPLVNGKGISVLKKGGLSVDVGLLAKEASDLNHVYEHWIRTGRPYVTLKGAMTLDGKIATVSGESRWITGKEARKDVHRIRSQTDAIMVGIGTVLRDDPELSARGSRPDSSTRIGRQPLRIVVDSHLRIPLNAKILTWVLEQPTIVCTTKQATNKKIERLREQGAQVWVVPSQGGKVSLKRCLSLLGKKGVSSLLVEGGGTLNAAVLQQEIVNHMRLYIAPRLLGGKHAQTFIGGNIRNGLDQTWDLVDPHMRKIGSDWLVTGRLR